MCDRPTPTMRHDSWAMGVGRPPHRRRFLTAADATSVRAIGTPSPCGTVFRVNTAPNTHPSLVDLTPGEEKVLLQTLQFEAALSGLLVIHANRWVVWLDGLRSVHDTEAEAHAWVADNLSPDSGRVIARVAPRRPVPLSGIAAFRFGVP